MVCPCLLAMQEGRASVAHVAGHAAEASWVVHAEAASVVTHWRPCVVAGAWEPCRQGTAPGGLAWMVGGGTALPALRLASHLLLSEPGETVEHVWG